MRLPLWTLLLCGTALLVFAVPQLQVAFVYEREAIGNGELWRLATGNLVHFTPPHLLKDLVALLVAGTILEPRNRRLFPLLCLVSGLAIGVALYVVEPHVMAYGGLSGVVIAAFAYLALEGAGHRDTYGLMCRAGLVALAAKVAFELALGPREMGGFVLVPLSHAMGAATGSLLFAVTHGARRPVPA